MRYLIRIEGVLSLFFVILIIFSFDEPLYAIMTLLAALIHELGHVLPMLFSKKISLDLPHGQIDGFRILLRNHLSYKEELLVLSLGPLANLFSALIFYLIGLFFGEYYTLFSFFNLITMLSNLLPLGEYDGYKIARCIIQMCGEGADLKIRHLNRISFMLCALLTFFSLYFILKLGSGYWIFSLLVFELIKHTERSTFSP